MNEIAVIEQKNLAAVVENNGVRTIAYDKGAILKFLAEKEAHFKALTIEPEFALSLRDERAKWNKFLENLKRTRIDVPKEYLKPMESMLKGVETDFKSFEKTAGGIISRIDAIIQTGEELRRSRRRDTVLAFIDELELPEGVQKEQILITDSMLVHSNNKWDDEIHNQISLLVESYKMAQQVEQERIKREAQEADNLKHINKAVSSVNQKHGINLDERNYYACRQGFLGDALELIDHDAKIAIAAKKEKPKADFREGPKNEPHVSVSWTIKITTDDTTKLDNAVMLLEKQGFEIEIVG